MQIEDISIKRYSYHGDDYYLIDGGLYYSDKYGMHFICADCQMVGDRKYTNEEYIREDPNYAISALKNREMELERYQDLRLALDAREEYERIQLERYFPDGEK